VKTCPSCEKEKPFSDFHRRGPTGYQGICKLCRKADDKDRYEKDPQRHAKVRRQRDAEILVWATALKEGAPCVDCGGSFHPAAMQWDHIGTDKRINISDAVHKGWSRARILTEIAKCELVCSNCHAVEGNSGMWSSLARAHASGA
jgi:hypothetical protein